MKLTMCQYISLSHLYEHNLVNVAFTTLSVSVCVCVCLLFSVFCDRLQGCRQSCKDSDLQIVVF